MSDGAGRIVAVIQTRPDALPGVYRITALVAGAADDSAPAVEYVLAANLPQHVADPAGTVTISVPANIAPLLRERIWLPMLIGV